MNTDDTVTIYDVAREAGVSMATVSRWWMEIRTLKKIHVKKVLEVIERLDYRPNAVARGLASKKTTTVGVVIPNITNSYFSTLAKGIDDIAEMYKYNIVLANSDEDYDKEVSVVNNLFSKQVDGIIFMGYHLTEKDSLRIFTLSYASCPCWDSGCWTPITKCQYWLQTSNRWCCYTVGKTQQENCFVSGPLVDDINGKIRLTGYKEALKAKKIEL